MDKRILIVSVLIVVVGILLMYFTLTMGSLKPVVSLVNNTSFTGRLRIINSCPRSEGRILVQSDVNGSLLTSRILFSGSSCKPRVLLSENNRVVTGVAILSFGNESFIAVSSYRIEAGGTASDIRVYDSDGKLIWGLEDSKTVNVTITCGIESNSFILASLDPQGQIHISKLYVDNNGVGYEWNKTFSISPSIQFNNILLSLNSITNTIAVASGRTLLVLNYNDGAILLGVRDIGGRIVKLENTWREYYLLVRKYDTGKIIRVYKSDNGLWNYTIVYENKSIVDFKPSFDGEDIAVVAGTSFSLLNENSSSKIILVKSNGDVMGETTVKGVVIGLSNLKRVGGNLYLLLDYAVARGSSTTYYSAIILLGGNEFAWKYTSLRPVRSTWIGSKLLVLEYTDHRTILDCYSITFP